MLHALHGYIVRILHYFANKFCNFTNFKIFFLTVLIGSSFFPTLKFSLLCKLSIGSFDMPKFTMNNLTGYIRTMHEKVILRTIYFDQ